MTDTGPDGDTPYEIRVRGRLDPRWSDWLDGCAVTALPDGTTAIRVEALDQSALHGLLRRVRDAGLPPISVTRTDPTPTTPPERTT
jgi:hypothetical protein